VGKLSKQANILYSAAYHWWTGLPIVRMLHLMYLSSTAWVHYVQPSSATKTMHLRGLSDGRIVRSDNGHREKAVSGQRSLRTRMRRAGNERSGCVIAGKETGQKPGYHLIECTDICPRPGDCLFLGHLPPSTTCASSGYG